MRDDNGHGTTRKNTEKQIDAGCVLRTGEWCIVGADLIRDILRPVRIARCTGCTSAAEHRDVRERPWEALLRKQARLLMQGAFYAP